MPKKYVSARSIGLLRDSTISKYRHCPVLHSLESTEKDLVIYGGSEAGNGGNPYYVICSYKDFEDRGLYPRTASPEYTYSEVLKAFEKKNEKVKKLKDKYNQYVVFIANANNNINKYNADDDNATANINQIDAQIKNLSTQLNRLKQQKQEWEAHKTSLQAKRDECFKQLGIIEAQKKDLEKDALKYLGRDGKIEDLANLEEGRIYYHNMTDDR